MDLFGAEPAVEETAIDNDSQFAHMDEFESDLNPGENLSDRLLPPSQSQFCIGHEAIEKQILEAFNNDRMPHGLIFSGQEGIGKNTFAFRLIRFLMSRPVDDPNQGGMFGDSLPAENATNFDVAEDHSAVSKITSGGHPDLMVVERALDPVKQTRKGAVDVAQIRKVIPFLRMTSTEGGWRVVMIDDADTMNRSAQNALLKILEEPPEKTILILITHRLGALLPTIRSRTQLLQFNPLEEEHVSQILSRAGVDAPQDIADLNFLAQGSPGRALSLKEQGCLELMDRLEMILKSNPVALSSLHALGNELGAASADQAFQSFYFILQAIFQNLIFAKARGQRAYERFEFLSEKYSLETLIEISDRLAQHFEQVINSNLERRYAILKAFEIIQR